MDQAFTEFGDSSLFRTARTFSAAISAILFRVSIEALPMYGASTTFSSLSSFGWTFGSSSYMSRAVEEIKPKGCGEDARHIDCPCGRGLSGHVQRSASA